MLRCSLCGSEVELPLYLTLSGVVVRVAPESPAAMEFSDYDKTVGASLVRFIGVVFHREGVDSPNSDEAASLIESPLFHKEDT